MPAIFKFSQWREWLPGHRQVAQWWGASSTAFGRPEWFRERATGWGLTPVCWQGWAYVLAWIGGIAIPTLSLALRFQGTEALIWLSASSALLFHDVRTIRRQIAVARETVFILDERPSDHLATKNYQFFKRA